MYTLNKTSTVAKHVVPNESYLMFREREISGEKHEKKWKSQKFPKNFNREDDWKITETRKMIFDRSRKKITYGSCRR